jgi:hypothetical protein
VVQGFRFYPQHQKRKGKGEKGGRKEGRKRGREEEKERKEKRRARHWWLTPVILATQEAEIRRVKA